MPEIIRIPQLKEHLMEIKFISVDKDILFKHKQGRVKMTIVLKSGEKNSVLFKEPFGVLTPVIFKIHSENCSYIGFSAGSSVNTFEGGVSISDIPLYVSLIRSIHGGTKLESVSHIEICTEPIT